MHNMGFTLNEHSRLPFQNIDHRITCRGMFGQLFSCIEGEEGDVDMRSPGQRHADDLILLIIDQIAVSHDDSLSDMLKHAHDV